MRQIILDTETTGLSPEQGHRVIEIGCVEMINRRLTGEVYHVYINPEREVDKGAERVHGITSQFLLDKPLFGEIAEAFKAFIEGAQLVIHNAPFDVGFLQHEFKLLKDKQWSNLAKQCEIIDTLAIARKKHPGQRNNLDALCKRYQVNNQHRDLHGALLDAEILADVYLAMTGGQSKLNLTETAETSPLSTNKSNQTVEKSFELMIKPASQKELADHAEFLKQMQKHYKVTPIWQGSESDVLPDSGLKA